MSRDPESADPLLPPPRILLVIHNYTAFTECFPEAEERLSRLTRDSVRYGIHLLVTAVSSGGIRFRSLQNFPQLLTLRQSDPAEYAAILGPVGGLIPGEQKGRGLIRLEAPVEFQTAAVCRGEPLFSFIQKKGQELRSSWSGNPAPLLPTMPEAITVDLLKKRLAERLPLCMIPEHAGSARPKPPRRQRLSLPLGYDCTALTPFYYDFSARPLTPILSESPCLPFFQLLAALLPKIGKPVLLPDPAEEQPLDLQIERTADVSPGSSPVLLIPDLPALFESLSEESASQLRDRLEQAPRSGACSIIFGGSPQELSAFTYEKWFRAGVSSRDGIWLGPGFSGQYLLKAPGAAAFDDCSERHAICLQGGRAVLIRLPEDCGLT